MYLSKFLSFCGLCSRRKSVDLIKSGQILVNGQVVTEVTYQVQTGDKVTYQGKLIKPHPFIYIVLNKPKDYITTTSDEKGRRTVLDLIDVSVGRIYPIGRLDRMTTGVLLLTNDGDFAQQLAHPKYNISKIYKVLLDKKITDPDFENIKKGVKLKDGFIKVDKLSLSRSLKTDLLVGLHSGKNRIVRRIFEHLGYKVKKLDRVSFAGITTAGLKRGEWRVLTTDEMKKVKK